MWLAHHWPDRYDRCVRVGRLHFCARCLVLYPVILLIGLLFDTRGSGIGVAMMWLLPVPMTLEWVLEQHRWIHYSQKRQLAVATVAAIGIGVAASVHFRSPFGWVATAPMVFHVSVCCVSTILASVRFKPQDEQYSWETQFEREEAERLEHLQALVSREDAP